MNNWPYIQAKRDEKAVRTEVMELNNQLQSERQKNDKLRKHIKELEAQLKFKPNAYDNDGNPIQYGVSGGARKCQKSK